MLLLFTSYFYCILVANLHAFHVSVCEVYHNPKTQSLEISMKIFIDDLELAIQKSGHSDFKLLDTEEENVEKIIIEAYLIDHFQITINGKKTNLEFVGFEFDADAILCYFEGDKRKKIQLIEITNSMITEVYDDQINLTHFQYNGEMKSLKATNQSTTGIIDTSAW